DQGRFTIRILKGQKGILFGGMFSFVGQYEKCPAHDKLLAKGKSSIETPTVKIDAVSDIVDVELKFAFPGCQKAKVD
ncbi:MAG: hypothetical protein ACRD43_10760, partial [Pyrinomonadaceae bacterium]